MCVCIAYRSFTTYIHNISIRFCFCKWVPPSRHTRATISSQYLWTAQEYSKESRRLPRMGCHGILDSQVGCCFGCNRDTWQVLESIGKYLKFDEICICYLQLPPKRRGCYFQVIWSSTFKVSVRSFSLFEAPWCSASTSRACFCAGTVRAACCRATKVQVWNWLNESFRLNAGFILVQYRFHTEQSNNYDYHSFSPPKVRQSSLLLE